MSDVDVVLRENNESKMRDFVSEDSKPKRSPEVQAQIDAARSDDERRADVDAYFRERASRIAPDESPEPMLVRGDLNCEQPGYNAVADLGSKEPSTVIVGAELAAYQRLHAASKAAQVAQDAIATTGAELRDAIQGLCAILGRK